MDSVDIHPELMTGAGGQKKLIEMWIELGRKLNSLGVGPHKLVREWRKAFLHWKTQTRWKERYILANIKDRNGELTKTQTLSALEKRLLSACERLDENYSNSAVIPKKRKPMAINVYERPTPYQQKQLDLQKQSDIMLSIAVKRVTANLGSLADTVQGLIASNNDGKTAIRNTLMKVLEMNSELIRHFLSRSSNGINISTN